MFKMIKNFIIKLQNSDETTKKIWLFILSGFTMAIVITFWMVYLNSSLIALGPAALPSQEKAVAQATDNEPGFFAIFGAGVKTIFDELKERLVSKTNIVIESPERNFIAENIELIEATELP